MKKLSTILILILITAAIMGMSRNNYIDNPYSGKYVYNKNTNICLSLGSNNSFTMYEAMDKFVDYCHGKYSVTDNKIVLKFNDKDIFNPLNKTLKGEVEGARINLKDSDGYFIKSE